MLPRHPGCPRAVQRQLLPPSDSIWISDSLLLMAYETFFAARISRPGRRHGSFVPGPLESRRRMGKRKMAHMSNTVPCPAHIASSLWGWLGEVDRTQWRWEAPTARPPETNTAAVLPGWLSSGDASPENDAAPTNVVTRARKSTQDFTFGRPEVLKFQHEIQGEAPGERLEICARFNRHIKQSLTIGIIPDTTLYETLSIVTSEIEMAFPDAPLTRSQKFAFYQAVWDGISTCKVFHLDSFQPSTMDKLLALISDLSMSLDVRVLAHSILTCVSACQLEGMQSSIVSMIKEWSRSLLDKEPIDDYEDLLIAALDAVKNAEHCVGHAKRTAVGMRARPVTELDITYARHISKKAESNILLGIKAVKQVESALFPIRSSIATLCDSLRRVTTESLNHIIDSCSVEIATTCRGAEKYQTRIRLAWLTVIAQLPNVRDGPFTNTWQNMEDSGWHVPDDFGSDLVLSHMVSQGYIGESATLRNTFEAAPARSTRKDYGCLLFALDQHQDNLREGARYVLGFLNNNEKYWVIYKTFSTMKSLGMRIPVEITRQAINILSQANARLAYNIFRMYVPTHYSIEQLDLPRCPEFVLSMIHDDQIQPENIWKALEIPLYEELKSYEWPGCSKDPLPPAMIDLITRMATAFSRSRARPQRVALRNVMQCVSHLRRYQVPISPQLSKAISYAGLTREVIRENWIGTERLRWALGMVEYAEGVEVRNTVDTAIWHWRQNFIQKQRDDATR